MMRGFFKVVLSGGKQAYVRLDSIDYITRSDGSEGALEIHTSSGTIFIRSREEVSRVWALFEKGSNP